MNIQNQADVRQLTDDERIIIDELYKSKVNHQLTHAYVTTVKQVELKCWNGKHPYESNHIVKKIPVGTTLKIVMVSRFGDCGLTDDLAAEMGYHLRVNFDDACITNIRRIP
jgi:hypothetical protein